MAPPSSRLVSVDDQSGHIVRGYMVSFLTVAIAVLGTFALRPWMGTSLSVLFFTAMIVAAMYGGYGPSLLATFLSSVALAFFFVAPSYSFDIGPDDLIRLLVFAAVALVTAQLSASQKQAELVQRRALAESREALATLRKVSGVSVLYGHFRRGGETISADLLMPFLRQG